MILASGTFPPADLANGLFAVLVDTAGKATVLLLLAAGAALAARRASAAVRHLIWTAAVAGLFVLPVMAWALPAWRVLPRWAQWPAPAVVEPAVVEHSPVVAPQWPAPTQSAGLAKPLAMPAPAPPGAIPPAAPAPSRPMVNPPATFTPPPAALPMSWTQMVAWVWALGAACMLLPLGVSLIALRRMARRAEAMAEVWGNLLNELRTRMGIRRHVRLAQCRRRTVPMTFGMWRPVILAPANAWGAERRQIVLLHELAHIQRHDCLTMLLARLARAFFWFHPLMWLACTRMAIEAERACDDMVLAAGTRSSEYASELLSIASGFSAHPALASAALTMARPSTLETRLRGILDATRNRRALTRTAVLTALVAGIGLIVPLARLKSATPAPSVPTPTTTRAAAQLPDPAADNLRAWIGDFFNHNYRDITARTTVEWGPLVHTPDGNLSMRYQYDAIIWERQKITDNKVFTFTPEGKFVSAENVAGFPVDHGPIAAATAPAAPPIPEDQIEDALHQWVEKFFRQNYIDITARQSMAWGRPEKLPDGNWRIGYTYRATIRDKDIITTTDTFTFTPNGTFVSTARVAPASAPAATDPATQPAARQAPEDGRSVAAMTPTLQFGWLNPPIPAAALPVPPSNLVFSHPALTEILFGPSATAPAAPATLSGDELTRIFAAANPPREFDNLNGILHRVFPLGTPKRIVHVTLDNAKLLHHGLTSDDIRRALEAHNLKQSTAEITAERTLLRFEPGEGGVDLDPSIHELEAVVLKGTEGIGWMTADNRSAAPIINRMTICLSDLGTVTESFDIPATIPASQPAPQPAATQSAPASQGRIPLTGEDIARLLKDAAQSPEDKLASVSRHGQMLAADTNDARTIQYFLRPFVQPTIIRYKRTIDVGGTKPRTVGTLNETVETSRSPSGTASLLVIPPDSSPPPPSNPSTPTPKN